MSSCVIGETVLSEFEFIAGSVPVTATMSSLTCEGIGGEDEYSYSVLVKDENENVVMKEITHDFQNACDIYDRLSILVEKTIV